MTEIGHTRSLILQELSFVPNVEQLALIEGLALFLNQRSFNDVFVLNGYAGTGKTSVMGAFVKALKELKIKTVVMAPTGRAAKVAANFALGNASTIHKRLFRGNSADPSNSAFFLAQNTERNTIFIVDEASLITDGNSLNNSLLQQLVRYVYSGLECNMILVGDSAQLPPVGQTSSQAIDPERLRSLGLNPVYFSLTEPARHASESGVLLNATIARKFLTDGLPLENFSFYTSEADDVRFVDPAEMLD